METPVAINQPVNSAWDSAKHMAGDMASATVRMLKDIGMMMLCVLGFATLPFVAFLFLCCIPFSIFVPRQRYKLHKKDANKHVGYVGQESQHV